MVDLKSLMIATESLSSENRTQIQSLIKEYEKDFMAEFKAFNRVAESKFRILPEVLIQPGWANNEKDSWPFTIDIQDIPDLSSKSETVGYIFFFKDYDWLQHKDRELEPKRVAEVYTAFKQITQEINAWVKQQQFTYIRGATYGNEEKGTLSFRFRHGLPESFVNKLKKLYSA